MSTTSIANMDSIRAISGASSSLDSDRPCCLGQLLDLLLTNSEISMLCILNVSIFFYSKYLNII